MFRYFTEEGIWMAHRHAKSWWSYWENYAHHPILKEMVSKTRSRNQEKFSPQRRISSNAPFRCGPMRIMAKEALLREGGVKSCLSQWAGEIEPEQNEPNGKAFLPLPMVESPHVCPVVFQNCYAWQIVLVLAHGSTNEEELYLDLMSRW